MADWVLGKFQDQDRKTVDAAMDRAADALKVLVTQGLDKAMNMYNG